MLSKSRQGNKLWAEIDRVLKLLKQMEIEAERLDLDITKDTLYLSLKAYVVGLQTVDSLN